MSELLNAIFWWTGAAVWFVGGMLLAIVVMANLLYRIAKASWGADVVIKAMHEIAQKGGSKWF